MRIMLGYKIKLEEKKNYLYLINLKNKFIISKKTFFFILQSICLYEFLNRNFK